MKTFLTILITTVIVTALFLLTARYKPSWLIKLEYDENGFPRVRSKGDKFLLNNSTYLFDGNVWVKLDANGFPLDPKPTEGSIFINNNISYTYTNGAWVVTNQTKRELNIFLLDKNGYVINKNGSIVGQKYNCPPGYGREQYPADSIYYPYYHCVRGRASF